MFKNRHRPKTNNTHIWVFMTWSYLATSSQSLAFCYLWLIHWHKKKCGSLYLLLVPHIEALALPLVVEQATQRPTPNMFMHYKSHSNGKIHIPHWTSTVASFFTTNLNLHDSEVSRTKRQVNTFLYVMCSQPCTRHISRRTSAKERLQI